MKPHWLTRVMAIIFTVIAFLLFGLIVFQARASLTLASLALSALADNSYLPRALDRFYLVTLGMVWLISWFVFESYFIKGITKNTLLPRFLRVLGWELVALFIVSIAAYLFNETGINWLAIGLLSAALVAGGVLVTVSRRMLSAPQKISL